MRKTILLFLAFVLASPAWGRSPAPAGRLLVPAAQPFVTLFVNGQQLRLKLDLGAHGTIILNPSAAARGGLQNDGSVTMRIGPVNLLGSQAWPVFQLQGARWKSRVMWFDRNYVRDADGVIGPHHLPYQEVVFEGPGKALGPPVRLQAKYNDDRGVFSPITIAGKKVAVRFSFLQPQSFATGSAGALLAKQQGGNLEGKAIQQHIGWDVLRPVRRLALAAPWLVGSFGIRDILVRLRDYRGKSALPSLDPDAGHAEILVTARASGRQAAEHFLTIGFDQLKGCESATYSRGARQLSFQC